MQDVLAKVGGGAAMTIAEATMIADNALEHTVRSLLAALQAPEILKSTQGVLSGHLFCICPPAGSSDFEAYDLDFLRWHSGHLKRNQTSTW